MKDWKVEQNENEMIIKIPREKNYSIEDLEQSLINELNNAVGDLDSFKGEIELLKIILEYKKTR